MDVRIVTRGARVGHAELVVSRPRVSAAESDASALYAARAALKRAHAMRAAAELLQVDQMRALVTRLEGR